MLKNFILKILWPANWFKAYFISRQKNNVSRAIEDPQLKLYDKILGTGFLHYAYFDNPEMPPDKISLNDIRQGQIRYAELILDQVKIKNGTVLDVGCGMGGLIAMLLQKGLTVTGLTPDRVQIDYIKTKHPLANLIKAKFQKMQTGEYHHYFDTVIHSESLQYINLEKAIENVLAILKPEGRWIVVDYFRLGEAHEKSGHHWDDFLLQLDINNLKIIYSQDITINIRPTLEYIYLWANEIGLPVFNFLIDKLKTKHPGKHFFAEDIINELDRKIRKNLDIVNPDIFTDDKKYILMSIIRN